MRTLLVPALFALLSLSPALALAGSQSLTVTADSSSVFARPDDSSQVMMKARKGQKLTSDGTQENGYYRLVTKSGRALWISAADVQAESYDAAADLAGGASSGGGDSSFRRLTFDLGGSSNLSGQGNAYELHLGVNLFLLQWLVWRNAPFYRRQSGFDPEYGLDSSLDGHYALRLVPGFTPSIDLGGGYRIINTGANAPFVEGGASLAVGGLTVGASVKEILNSAAGDGLPNETLYSVNFSGGLSF